MIVEVIRGDAKAFDWNRSKFEILCESR
jgi:hypothetical protein